MKHPTEKELERKKKNALHMPAAIHMGKKGITPSLIQETAHQLELKDVVKIKVLKSVEDPESILSELANACNAVVWKQVGRVGILVLK